RSKLEFTGSEITRLRRAAWRERGSDRAIPFALDSVTAHARHPENVSPDDDALRMLRRDVGALVPRKRVLVGHQRPAVLDGESLPRRHRRPFALEGLDLSALADPPEPVVVAHLGSASLVAEVRRLHRQRHPA